MFTLGDHLDSLRFPRVHLVHSGSPWFTQVDTRDALGSLRFTQGTWFQLGDHFVDSVLIGFPSDCWITLVHSRDHSGSLGFTRIHSGSLGFTWDPLGSLGFHWGSLRFIGFTRGDHSDSPGFTSNLQYQINLVIGFKEL